MLALLSMARNYRPNWFAAYVLAGERGGVGWFGCAGRGSEITSELPTNRITALR
jgi:hypothetical protein